SSRNDDERNIKRTLLQNLQRPRGAKTPHRIIGQDYVERGCKPANKIFLGLDPRPLRVETRSLQLVDDQLRVGRPIFYDQGVQRGWPNTHEVTFESMKWEMSDCFGPREGKHNFGSGIPAQHCSVPGRRYNSVRRFC